MVRLFPIEPSVLQTLRTQHCRKKIKISMNLAYILFYLVDSFIHSIKLTEHLLHARKDIKVAWPKVMAVDLQKNRWVTEILTR